MKNLKSNIVEELISLNIIQKDFVKEIYPRTRDNASVHVNQCQKSNIIFLSSNEYKNDERYEEKKFIDYWGGGRYEDALKNTYVDDKRRFDQFSELIRNKDYLDFGTGLGGALNFFKPVAKSICGIELQLEIRQYLCDHQNYKVFGSIDEIPSDVKMDIVSLFHVFEHLSKPLEYLKKIKASLKDQGKIIIEVPHANDALISLFKLEEFMKFTFWSEHLILHTRSSIEVYLRAAGFRNIVISGFQRYPLSNHLYWLSKKKPGGHLEMGYFQSSNLNSAYSDLLNSIDKTDTLIAIAEK